MTAPTGWLCPACKKAHGPAIQTCPEASPRDLMGRPVGLPYTPAYMTGARCSCKPGEACGNAACPFLPTYTCTAPSSPRTPWAPVDTTGCKPV